MSKKTIVFKMPAPDSAGRADAPGDAAAPIMEASSAAEPDRWVRRRDLDLAPASPASPAKRSIAFDIAAERDFGEVVALSLIVPPMLGWFWFVNTMNRFRRTWAD